MIDVSLVDLESYVKHGYDIWAWDMKKANPRETIARHLECLVDMAIDLVGRDIAWAVSVRFDLLKSFLLASENKSPAWKVDWERKQCAEHNCDAHDLYRTMLDGLIEIVTGSKLYDLIQPMYTVKDLRNNIKQRIQGDANDF